MNICKWCNCQVSDERTVWYRRNLVLGFSFCSTKCATEWKSSIEDSKSKPNDNSLNLPNEQSYNENFDYGNVITKPKNVNDFKSELRYQEKLQNQLKGKQHANDISDQESAEKIMTVVRKLSQYWKIVVPLYIVAFAFAIFLLDQKHSIMIVIAFLLPVIAIIWAYFTAPKS